MGLFPERTWVEGLYSGWETGFGAGESSNQGLGNGWGLTNLYSGLEDRTIRQESLEVG